ncbi:MAG: hypothetical protein KDA24_10715 [Deltaproteobacteria bacterium]|nr:hypothetical protein [Deltaproteobacteria bacterium]
MADDEINLSTAPFQHGRTILQELGVTLPDSVAPVAAPDPDLDPSLRSSFGQLTAVRWRMSELKTAAANLQGRIDAVAGALDEKG